jgi:UPF0755 protein
MRDIIRRSRLPKKLPPPPRWLMEGALFVAAVFICLALGYAFIFGPAASRDTNVQEFVVAPGLTREDVASTLKDAGLIKHRVAFLLASFFTDADPVAEGGYRVSASMDVWTVLHTLTEAPYLAWVVVPEGKRKEEAANIFAEALGWTNAERDEYLASRAIFSDFEDGVYAPGTYLMPSDLAPGMVATRVRAKFQEQIAPYLVQLSAQNLSLMDTLTLASIVERESAKNDKALVAGILLNRLERDMRLQADATMQYVTGNEDEGWWHAPDPDDKYIESPFNTYRVEGLPPGPIATPSIASIEAVLSPDATSCLYYLHDGNGRIHCAPTYKGHLANIERHLR